MSFIQKLHHFISGQVPEYVVDEYPVFVTFLEAYYKFLDDAGQANNRLFGSLTWTDIDNTLDEFIPRFRAQYAYDFPESSLLAARRLLKYIGEFYEGKGSETSTALFFRFLYNETASVYYPGDYVLRTSDGVWRRRIIVKLDTTGHTTTTFALRGKRIQLVYLEFIPGRGNVRRVLETRCFDIIRQIEPNIFQLEIDLSPLYIFPEDVISPSTEGQILGTTNTTPVNTIGAADTFVYVVFEGEIFGRLSRQLTNLTRITFPGSNFRIDDSFIISESGVEGKYFVDFDYVSNTDTDAVGATYKPYITDSFDNNAVIRITGLTPRKQTVGPYSLDDTPYFAEDYTSSAIPLGAGIDQLQIVKTGQRFTVPSFTIDVVPPVPRNANIPAGARLVFETGLIYHEPGQFKTSAGFLSDINKLQDNYYYQPYSYVVQSQQPLRTWKDTFLRSNHPTGFQLFSEWVLHNTIDSTSDISETTRKLYTHLVVDTAALSETLTKDIIKVTTVDYFAEDFVGERYTLQYDALVATDTPENNFYDSLAFHTGVDSGTIAGIQGGMMSGTLGMTDAMLIPWLDLYRYGPVVLPSP
jgi:hypothetical protein